MPHHLITAPCPMPMVLFTSGTWRGLFACRRVCVTCGPWARMWCSSAGPTSMAYRSPAGAEGRRLAATGGGQVPRHHPAELCRLRHFVRYLRPYLVSYSPRDGFGFFKTLFGKGEFTEESSEQYYDEEAGLFLADRYITGTCPNCGNTNAYGDQCEKCGKSLSPRELINPHSQLSGKPPVLRQTKHWYLPSTATSANGWKNGSTATAMTGSRTYSASASPGSTRVCNHGR